MAEDETGLVPVNLFGVRSAVQVIEAAKDVATPLAQLIEDRGLFSMISGRRHVRVEGWALLGSMLGVFPIVVWSRPVEEGWEARVEVRTQAGALIGAAEAECLRSEPVWADRLDYAIRSMAQTRATSKALRLPLGFVIQLAGFETTPAEEMDGVEVASGPPCPHCHTPVAHNPNPTGGKPIWSCPNRSCGGGDPARPRKDGTLWPWASWEPDFFVEGKEEVKVSGPTREAPEVPADAWDNVKANLVTLGISEVQARAEIETMAAHPGFAAGTLAKIRGRVNRAIVLCVALGLDGEGLMGDLWKEWQGADEKRATLTWSTCRAGDVLDFARSVQGYLRARLA